MKKGKQIIKAGTNLITDGIGLTDHQNSDMALSRMAICNACDNLNNNVCQLCECYMPGKTTVKEATCKINKW